jgi:hypothetical protein
MSRRVIFIMHTQSILSRPAGEPVLLPSSPAQPVDACRERMMVDSMSARGERNAAINANVVMRVIKGLRKNTTKPDKKY